MVAVGEESAAMAQWNHSFLSYLLLNFVASFMLQVSAGADDDSPFVDREGAKGFQVVRLENLNLPDFNVDCRGYQNHKLDRPFFIKSGKVRTNASFTIEFDRVKTFRLFEVYCTYNGTNGCSAERVRVFFAPGGEDLYHCSKRTTVPGGCRYIFRDDFEVFKLIGRRDAEYIGDIPTKKNYRKTCIGSWCFYPFWVDKVIGEVQCCAGDCN